ncbi:MAG: 3,4-dehydroadipyl-CoA semialdehyde dehydrogenase [bacterium]
MKTLRSYLCDQWQAGQGTGSTLYDPTTGAAVATASTDGLDLAAAFAHARSKGRESLAAMTFAERGALLRAMSKAIHARREQLIETGRINGGNTRGDAKFDIDGATGTLMYYAGLGKELGDRKVLLDGDPITIGASSRLQGQHILTPRPGVAVHINAFNFPAWGLAEKAACAILAGVPVISKPGTATAMLTVEMVEAVVDAEILPPGVLSLVVGSARDLVDHAQWSDVIAFTGSADTGEQIRQQALATGATVNIEADSLNATVLVPDAADATYDAFIRDVAREMTQKAGQKCTATRRVFVPADMVDDVIEDLGERLGQISVGDPARDDVRMGPLASQSQYRAAREGIETLLKECDVAWGQVERGPLPGVDGDIDPGVGCFVTPLLLRARDGATAVHDLEVFGPVSTVIAYAGDPASAADGVRRGQGSLVCSIYGDDRDFLGELIPALAGWHGRVVVTDGKIADKAFGPGMVLPHLIHGGPGRAGGGEELGGLRGMQLYQQRTAVQGNGPLLAKLLDR